MQQASHLKDTTANGMDIRVGEVPLNLDETVIKDIMLMTADATTWTHPSGSGTNGTKRSGNRLQVRQM